jgi:hypothetical protein
MTQECGTGWIKPSYLTNYLLFFGAVRARYPHMRLISNCDLGPDAPIGMDGAPLAVPVMCCIDQRIGCFVIRKRAIVCRACRL